MDEVVSKWDGCGEVRKDDTARTFVNCSQLNRVGYYYYSLVIFQNLLGAKVGGRHTIWAVINNIKILVGYIKLKCARKLLKTIFVLFFCVINLQSGALFAACSSSFQQEQEPQEGRKGQQQQQQQQHQQLLIISYKTILRMRWIGHLEPIHDRLDYYNSLLVQLWIVRCQSQIVAFNYIQRGRTRFSVILQHQVSV